MTGDPTGPWWGLAFPQWQGAGAFALPIRARARELAERYRRVVSMETVPVDTTVAARTAGEVYALETLARQGRAARHLVERRRPDRILTLGGDCGVEIVPVSYLNARYEGRLAVLWFDAHADANNPDTSPSGNFHGMPIRTLLGDGPGPMRDLLCSVLRPEQVFLIGTRALDPGETAFIETHGLSRYRGDGPGLHELPDVLAARGLGYLYLHVDLDVIDPTAFSAVWYPTPNGLSPAALVRALRLVRERMPLVGASILESVPGPPEGERVIDEVVFEGFGLSQVVSTRPRRNTDA